MKKPVIGITWRRNFNGYEPLKKVIEEAGGLPVLLPLVISKAVKYDGTGQVISEELDTNGVLKQAYADEIKARDYAKTNVAEILKDIDGIFMIGGEDISPTLFKVPEAFANSEDIDAARDVSDYILMAYCMDKDIPILAVCRGMQMMGVVAGTGYIQDIRDYYKVQGHEYTIDFHRDPVGTPDNRVVRHDVELVSQASHLFKIVQASIMKNISSWHHQALDKLEGSGLVLTGKSEFNGVEIIEAIEHPGKKYCVGLQFHPDNDVKLVCYDKKTTPADYDAALSLFKNLVKYANEASR